MRINTFSNSKIDKIGQRIRARQQTPEDIAYLNEWRKSHMKPMGDMLKTLKRAFAYHKNYVIVQRLKRLATIEDKLFREPNMNLSRMQDVGGIRIIVPKITDIEKARSTCERVLEKYRVKLEHDYIINPKPDGYRGVHFVCKEENMKIELQLRTRIQHCWATTVEIVDLMREERIKAGRGSQEWKDFFIALSQFIALIEMPRKEISPEMADVFTDLILRIAAMDNKMHISDNLRSYRFTMDKMDSDGKGCDYFLIALKDQFGAQIIGYAAAKAEQAAEDYIKIEKDQHFFDQVLVSAKGMRQLKNAYPNYFLDVTEIIILLKSISENASKMSKI